MPFEKNPDEVGTLWKNTSKTTGKAYYKGTIKGVGEVICFPKTTKGGAELIEVRISRPMQPKLDEAPF